MFTIPSFLIPFADSMKLSAAYDIVKYGVTRGVGHAASKKKKKAMEAPIAPTHHIPRLCTDQEHPGVDGDAAEVYGFSLLDYCMEHQNVVLLGEAGCGKTQSCSGWNSAVIKMSICHGRCGYLCERIRMNLWQNWQGSVAWNRKIRKICCS